MAQDDGERNGQTPADEPLRPIRALMRGLETLAALNRQPSASVSEIAQAARLPRTTAYRVLETLCAAGYAARVPGAERYRLLPAARRLAEGLDEEPWVERIAKMAAAELARDLGWPLMAATLAGLTMRLHPLDGRLLQGGTAAIRLPLLASSAGLAFLAYAPQAQREALVDALAFSADPLDAPARDPARLAALLNDVRARGAAMIDDGNADLNLAVPVLVEGFARASLVVTVARSAVADQALDRLIALLARSAQTIAETLAAESAKLKA